MNILKTNNKGNLIVISGPSGAGKNTIVDRLLEVNPNTWLSISATTRDPRGEEKNGINYYFLNRKEFEKRISNNDFLEYAEYNGNYYGTPKSNIIEKLNSGIDVILEIEIQGALKIKKQVPNAIFIFILPPSMSELRRRLVLRKTETKDKVIQRFKMAYKEINEVTKYNYVVINDKVDDAVSKVNSILLSERCRVDRIEEVFLGNEEEEIHEILVDKDLENRSVEL